MAEGSPVPSKFEHISQSRSLIWTLLMVLKKCLSPPKLWYIFCMIPASYFHFCHNSYLIQYSCVVKEDWMKMNYFHYKFHCLSMQLTCIMEFKLCRKKWKSERHNISRPKIKYMKGECSQPSLDNTMTNIKSEWGQRCWNEEQGKRWYVVCPQNEHFSIFSASIFKIV